MVGAVAARHRLQRYACGAVWIQVNTKLVSSYKETHARNLAKLGFLKELADNASRFPDPEVVAAIRALERVVLPVSRHLGLKALPHELFLRILDELGRCYHNTTDTRFHIIRTLSSVSRRFRNGVLQTASFWSYWHIPSLVRSEISTRSHLERGGYSGIVIQTEPGDKRGTCQPTTHDELAWFLTMASVEKNLDKIAEMTFDATTVGKLLFSDKGGQLRPWTFPALKTLTLVDSVGYPEKMASWDRVFSEQGWMFPAVKELHISSFLPQAQVFKGITSLSFGCLRGVAFSEMRSFMLQLPKLTHLRLDKFEMTSIRIPDLGRLKEDDIEPLELPFVTSLQASNPSISGDSDMMHVLEKLRLPNLKDLRLELAGIEWRMRSLSCGASPLLTAIQSFQANSLESFAISISVDRHSHTLLVRPLLAMPSLKHLVLEYDSNALVLDERDPQVVEAAQVLSSLQSLRIINRSRWPPSETNDPYAVLAGLRPLVGSQPDVIIEAEDDLHLLNARTHFPQARREWFTDRSILQM